MVIILYKKNEVSFTITLLDGQTDSHKHTNTLQVPITNNKIANSKKKELSIKFPLSQALKVEKTALLVAWYYKY